MLKGAPSVGRGERVQDDPRIAASFRLPLIRFATP
jgi:hypothetical protein